MSEAVSLAQQIACVQRELQMRSVLYPKCVRAGRKTQEAATAGIAEMTAVLATLRSLAGSATAAGESLGLPMLSPHGELLPAPDAECWQRWCLAAVGKMESYQALIMLRDTMEPHLRSVWGAHPDQVATVRDAVRDRLERLAMHEGEAA